MTSPKGPYKLVTVNTAPERARRLIGRVVEDMKDKYTIQHVANCESACVRTARFPICRIITLTREIR